MYNTVVNILLVNNNETGSASPSLAITDVGDQLGVDVDTGTAFGSLVLPSSVTVTLSDFSTRDIAPDWQQGSYNGNVAGVYNILGTLPLPPGVSNPSNYTALVIVTVTGVTISLFASASNPTDNGTLTSTSPVAVTPPASMVAGQLVVLIGSAKSGSTGIDISVTGGQTWTAMTIVDAASNRFRIFFCEFNGTWDANPSIAFSVAATVTVVMHVFASSKTTPFWQLDVNGVDGNAFLRPGIVTVKISTVAIAVWQIGAANTFGASNNGWSTLGSAQYRNLGGSDTTLAFAYKLIASPKSSLDVTRTSASSTGLLTDIISITDNGVPPVTLGDMYIHGGTGQSNWGTSNGGPPTEPELQGDIGAKIYTGSATVFPNINYSLGNHNPGFNPENFGPILKWGYERNLVHPGRVTFAIDAQSGTSMFSGFNIENNGIGKVFWATFKNACLARQLQGYNIIPSGIGFRQGCADQPGTNPWNIDTSVNSVLIVSAAPSAGTGVEGDIAIDTVGMRIYCKYDAGTEGAPNVVWTTARQIEANATILSGSGAPSGATGANGNHYYDTAGFMWYGPKTDGVWPTGVIVARAVVRYSYLDRFDAWFKHGIDLLRANSIPTAAIKLLIDKIDNAMTVDTTRQLDIVAAQQDMANFLVRWPAYVGLCLAPVPISSIGDTVFDGVHKTKAAQVATGARFEANS